MIGTSGAIANLTANSGTTTYIMGKTAASAGWNGTFNVTSNYISGGSFFEPSDERLKNFEEDVRVDISELTKLPKKYFKWKHDENGSTEIGVSAQKLLKLYPELVSFNTETGYYHVAYEKLSVIALAAIDKLYEILQKQKKELDKLKTKLE